ncbi:hypothetical protein TBR22_A07420 [Luteitalea sp. TBR-22]|uniref:hypothetical protein n=1 Tax=Luteitalea sp. TBR-22 TaxID=2802971 RepID=UPI001AF5E4A1|nr:hypothetical protein [Luteitalea sp. TBR-22]BCS31541.1 hypothetical protein TBR22_A07420 [Luteitalea sp. TBR-22]
MPTPVVSTTGRGLPRWDAAALVLACLLAVAGPDASAQLGVREMAGAPTYRELLHAGDVLLAYVQPSPADGLEGAALRLTERGRTRDISLEGSLTARLARGIGRVWWLPDARRAILHVDPAHDAAGLLIVDAATDRVIDAVIGRDLTPSPTGRHWAFEEDAPRHAAAWPNTETVYAIYDAATGAEALARACPTADDRCRGEVVFLPDRLALCHGIARERGGSCLVPGRLPRHARRSPFSWLSPSEVAWVDVDLTREEATLVLATVREDAPARVHTVPLERSRVIEDVDLPPVREAWRIDRITRDGDPSRVWLHFRTRVPQAPLQRLGIRLF